MKTLYLSFGLLIGFAIVVNGAENSPEKKCDKPVPFACFVKEWEEEHHKGSIAFDYKTIEDKCKDLASCTLPCPADKDLSQYIDYDSETIEKDGVRFNCNPKALFCKPGDNHKGCIPTRKVTSLQKTSDSSGKLVEVEVETIMFPICRRGDSIGYCKMLAKNYPFCLGSQIANTAEFQLRAVPWNNLNEMCTVVEAPLGGGDPKWFADEIVEKLEPTNTKDSFTVQTIWRHTGLPYELVKQHFLPGRLLKYKKPCKKYEPDTKECYPLGLCDKDSDTRTQYWIEKSGEKFIVKSGPATECEKECKTWENPLRDGRLACRVLDTKRFTLNRQGSPPYAKLMTKEESLNKKSIETMRSRRGGPAIEETLSVSGAKFESDSKYPLPVSVDGVKNTDTRNMIIGNYWLSAGTNPFYQEYKEEILDGQPLPSLAACGNSKSDELCDSGETTTPGGLEGWQIALIVLGGLFGVCCIVVVVPLVVIGGYIFFVKRNTTPFENKEDTEMTAPVESEENGGEAKPLMDGNETATKSVKSTAPEGSKKGAGSEMA